MKSISSFNNNSVTLLLRRLLLALLVLALARVVFWVYNYSQFNFSEISLVIPILFYGFYYDFISIFYCLSPFILLHLILGNWFYNKKVQQGLKIFFIAILFILFTLTCIDAGYFPFSKSRLSITLFKMAGEEEISILRYMADYWFFIPVILSVIYFTYKFYPSAKVKIKLKWYFHIPVSILIIALFVITIRGGFRLKPLRSIDTALFVTAPYSTLVISTGFNFLESFTVESIEIPNYIDDKRFKEVMASDYHAMSSQSFTKKKNVVIIILESFGKEYTFPETNQAQSYTPFLQQLAKQGELFTRSYSSGTRSVDAIPAILEGVPKMTASDFMYTNYIQNTTPGFPFYLIKEGYNCSFFHGGKNGTMGFEAFLKSRGWSYYGKNEYQGKPQDFDGHWGIYDGPYLNYFANEIKKLKEPFVASIFTLSSHHPYSLPAEYKDSFKTIKKPIHKTIKYVDNCLRQYFETIKNESWYNETVFIITGDHSGENFTKKYQSNDGKYEVPIIVFEPSNSKRKENTTVIQHIDIIPLTLQKIGYQGKVFTIGTFFDSVKMAFQNEEGNYQVITNELNYNFDGSRFKFSTNKRNGSINNKAWYEFALKAKIQDYNYRMVNNKFF